MDNTNTCLFEILPFHLQYKIISLLPRKDLLTLASTNSYFLEIASNPVFWNDITLVIDSSRIKKNGLESFEGFCRRLPEKITNINWLIDHRITGEACRDCSPWNVLNELPQLTRMSLEFFNMRFKRTANDEAVFQVCQMVRSAAHLGHLRINLRDASRSYTSELSQILQCCNPLTSLQIRGNNNAHGERNAIEPDLTRHAKSLETLDIHMSPSTVDLCRNLTSLRLFSCTADCFARISKLSNLVRLSIDFSYHWITGEDWFTFLEHCLENGVDLKYLRISQRGVNVDLSDIHVASLSETFPNLRQLEIEGFQDITGRSFSFIQQLTSLEFLEIQDCNGVTNGEELKNLLFRESALKEVKLIRNWNIKTVPSHRSAISVKVIN